MHHDAAVKSALPSIPGGAEGSKSRRAWVRRSPPAEIGAPDLTGKILPLINGEDKLGAARIRAIPDSQYPLRSPDNFYTSPLIGAIAALAPHIATLIHLPMPPCPLFTLFGDLRNERDRLIFPECQLEQAVEGETIAVYVVFVLNKEVARHVLH